MDDADKLPLAGQKDLGAGWIVWLEDATAFGREAEVASNLDVMPEPVAVSPESLTSEEDLLSVPDALKFTLIPNPTEGSFVLETNTLQAGKETAIEVYSLLGERVYQWEGMVDASLFAHQIDLAEQQAGQYLVRLRSNGKQLTKLITLLR